MRCVNLADRMAWAVGVWGCLLCAGMAPAREGQTFSDLPPGSSATVGVVRLAPGVVPLRKRGDWVSSVGRRHVLVFEEALTHGRRADLDEAGIVLVQSMGGGVFLADLSGADREKVRGLGFVRGVALYSSMLKRSPDLGDRVHLTEDRIELARAGRERLVVHLFADSGVEDLDATLTSMGRMTGVEILHHTEVGGVQTITLEASLDIVPGVSELEHVQYIEPAPEAVTRSVEASWLLQSGVPEMRTFWDAGLTGAGQIIGVTDSGLATTHCSFTSVPGKLIAFNGPAAATMHGTHVAATAVGNPGTGGPTALRGHAYDAGLVFSRIPSFTQSNLTTVLETQSGPGQLATIHSNSWGDDGTKSYSGLSRAVDAFMHGDEDQLVVIASINGGQIAAPDNAKNGLTVSAGWLPPMQDSVCFGGRSLTSDGRLKPDVVAPGCDIVSALSGSSCGVTTMSGTSMATPAVSGIAALVRQYFMEGWYPSGSPGGGSGFVPSGALLKATVVNSAQDMVDEPGYPNDREGWGRVVLANAVPLSNGARRLVVEDVRNAAGLVTGSVVERRIQVLNSAEPLKVTMAWTDPPASPGAFSILVNDLDLEVISPSGEVYFGNWFVDGESAWGGMRDGLNNLEQVLISSPLLGEWRVRVVGADVRQDLQGYALVVTGGVAEMPSLPTVAMSSVPPVIAPESVGQFVEVTVSAGDDVIVPGSERLLVRYRSPEPEVISLEPLGHGVYRAMLPPVVCGATLEIAAVAEGENTGVVRTPAGDVWLRVAVDEFEETILLEERFESGLPEQWLTDGLWRITGACVSGDACEDAPWAYFGNPSSCSYNTGGRVFGSLQSRQIFLPPVGDGGRITLEYCSNMENENTEGFDLGEVYAGSVLVDEAGDTGGMWERRVVDLTSQQGRPVRIVWRFDSLDGQFNDFTGWQVDDIRVIVEQASCEDPCPGDVNFDGVVNLADFNVIAVNFGNVTNGLRWQGDLTGDGQVTMLDFMEMAQRYGAVCDPEWD